MSKNCKDCRHFKINGTNSVCTEFCNETTMYDDCKHFEQPTVFDQITQSPEVLAPLLVRTNVHEFTGIFYTSVIVCGSWNDEAEAIDATIEKLKEVEK